MGNDKGKVNKIIYVILFLLLGSIIFETGLFSYFDEIAAVIALVVLVFEFASSYLKTSLGKLGGLFIILIIIGIISNLLNAPERNMYPILVDILTTGKPFFIFAAFVQLSDELTFQVIKTKIIKVTKLFLLVALVFAILNLLGFFQMSQEIVFGLRNFKFFFGFPVTFSIFIYTLQLFVVSNDTQIFRQKYFWISLVLICSALKAQSIFFVIVLVSFYFIMRKKSSNIKISSIVGPAILGILCVIPGLLNYFATSEYSPRKILLEDGFDLAKNFFPIGAGFSTFGSPAASQFYSPIYLEKGYYFLYGLGTNGDDSFLSDMFLASVIGQFGFLGLIVFLLMILEMFIIVVRNKRVTNTMIIAISGVLSIVAVTMASSFFTSAIGSFFLAIVALVINSSENEKSFGD